MALNLLIIKSKQRLFYHSVANIREPRSTSTTYGTCAHQFSILIIESLQPTLTPSLTVGWLTLPPYESWIFRPLDLGSTCTMVSKWRKRAFAYRLYLRIYHSGIECVWWRVFWGWLVPLTYMVTIQPNYSILVTTLCLAQENKFVINHDKQVSKHF